MTMLTILSKAFAGVGAQLTVVVIAALLSAPQVSAQGRQNGETPAVVRIGVTPVFLDHQTAFLNEWKAYLEKRIKHTVQFVQRSSYQEITDLLLKNQLEFAWICGYPFVQHKASLTLVSVPLYKGAPLYQSYLIVPRGDERTQSIFDLEGKVFAFSDPNSNSGHLVPRALLWRLGITPESFFRKTFFTWAHRKVVEAVAAKVADAGAVDGYVWDTLGLTQPELVDKTRVVSKSRRYGFPPVVARKGIDRTLFDSFQRALLEMNKHPEGIELLKQLNIDGFSIQSPSLFGDIEALALDVPFD